MARDTGTGASGSRGRHFGPPQGNHASGAGRRHAAPAPHPRRASGSHAAPARPAATPGRDAGVTAPHATTRATARYAMSEVPDASPAASAGAFDGPAASSDAPRPTPVGDTTAFSTLGSGQGAVISSRETAADAAAAARGGRAAGPAQSRRLAAAARRNVRPRRERLQTNRRLFVCLGVAALAVVAVVAFLVVRAVNSTNAPADAGERVERTDVAPDESVSYDDYTYSIEQGPDGSYSFVRTQGDGEPLALFVLEGEPVQLVLCDGAYLIPENLPDGTWDVVAYTMGDGSVTTQLANPDGSPVTGEGRLASAALEGSELVLTDEAGSVTRVPVS